MDIVIELPTWLGDAVMTTPAIELIIKHYQDKNNKVNIIIIGQKHILDLFSFHPNVVKSISINKSFYKLYKIAKNLGNFDTAISFRSSFRAWFLLKNIQSNNHYQFKNKNDKTTHQVELYSNFITKSLNISTPVIGNIKIYLKDKLKKPSKKILGINPGASYGDAKRWHIDGFVNVAKTLAKGYVIKIFGSHKELILAEQIATKLRANNIEYENLTAKTNINTLVNEISQLSLFVTSDSGPMHIAAAFSIPTVAIFGPTRDIQTSQWQNKNSKIVKKSLPCQPCMQRVCPLKHHKCMLDISSDNVLQAIKALTR